jgi:lipopolysaccharide transport system ATP-binding protein
MEPIIQAKGVGKRYTIRHNRGGYIALRDVLMTILRSPFRFLKEKAKSAAGIGTKEEFWALKNVSFDVAPGEVVGIIGRNGAGKSTLLKILTGITPPTTGEITMRGRVASLLEVGTGFHPELTGRENIFLNGAILGMKRSEIAKNFDSIVEFAEVDKFLDTPVKYYSSGMYVRLAFSVAAHMEPDILLVDEVLAVGDSEFQKKCLGKMEEVTKKQGRTILFVSHNMSAIQRLCKKTILIEKGEVKMVGPTDKVIDHYLNGSKRSDKDASSAAYWENKGDTYTKLPFRPLSMTLIDKSGQTLESSAIKRSSELSLCLEAHVEKPQPALSIGYAIYDENNTLIYYSYFTDMPEHEWPRLSEGRWRFVSKIPTEFLNEGSHRVELIGGLYNQEWFFEPQHPDNPTVEFSIQGGLSDSPYWINRRPGTVAPKLSWKIDKTNKA